MLHYASRAIGKLEMHALSQGCAGKLIRHTTIEFLGLSRIIATLNSL